MPVVDMLSFKVPVGYAGRFPGGPLTVMLSSLLVAHLYFCVDSLLSPTLPTDKVDTPSCMSASREYSQGVAFRPAHRVPVMEFTSL